MNLSPSFESDTRERNTDTEQGIVSNPRNLHRDRGKMANVQRFMAWCEFRTWDSLFSSSSEIGELFPNWVVLARKNAKPVPPTHQRRHFTDGQRYPWSICVHLSNCAPKRGPKIVDKERDSNRAAQTDDDVANLTGYQGEVDGGKVVAVPVFSHESWETRCVQRSLQIKGPYLAKKSN